MDFLSARSVASYLQQHPPLHLVNGDLSGEGPQHEVIDPATGAVCARSPHASKALLDHAVMSARRAQPGWAATAIEERRALLLQFAALLRTAVAPLAGLLTLEQGRPLARTRDEVMRAASLLESVVQIDIGSDVLRDDARGRVLMLHKALGVVGAIAPWNVPIGLAVPKIVHALYTGNTIVLKPSPHTPLTTLKLGEFCRAIFPPGVLNIVAGGNDLGEWISTHPGIDKLSVTGSVATGKKVMASAASNLKRLTLELGGNDAAIVLSDASIDDIAPALFAGAFVNSGQVCMAIKRLFVPEALHDQLCDALGMLAREAVVGSGFDPTSELGPVQNRIQYESVCRVLDDTRGRPEARFHAGGRAVDSAGYFIEPTVVSGLREGCSLVDEETFGPVLPVLAYSAEEEAILRANEGPLGLGASIWTSDMARAEELGNRLVAGTVWINRHVGADAEVPFGGARESGLGQQFGRAGLLDCMQSTALYLPVVAVAA